ncbi:MAG: hypothetical protein ACLP36_12445 [Acidimicrobiales bacterium]
MEHPSNWLTRMGFLVVLNSKRGRALPQCLRQLANRWAGILHGVLEHDCLYDEATAWRVATDPAA